MNTLQLFDDIEFQPFDMAHEYNCLCLETAPEKSCEALGFGQYAIVPINWQPRATIKKHLSIPHFFNETLTIIKWNTHIQQEILSFRKSLIIIEWRWIARFLSSITKHLSNRVSQKTALLNHDHIRQAIAEIVTELEMCKMLLESEIILSVTLNHINRFVINIALKLMKLPGGRAFLKGSVLDMLWTFEAFHNVYYSI